MSAEPRTHNSSAPQVGAAAGERRRAPRINVLGQLDGWIQQLEMPVVVLDVASGGIGLATPQSMEVGSIHDLRLTNRRGDVVEIRTRVANCRAMRSATGASFFGVGLQVVGPQEPLEELIETLAPPRPENPN